MFPQKLGCGRCSQIGQQLRLPHRFVLIGRNLSLGYPGQLASDASRCRGIFYPPDFLSGRIVYSIRPDNFS